MLITHKYWKTLLIFCVLCVNYLAAIPSPFNWVQDLTIPNPPPARFDASMAFDPISGNLLLFGGNNGDFGYYGDTWIWNGTDWTQLSPINIPPARAAASLALDPVNNRLLLFGGYNGSFLDDTWEWNGTDWILLNPENSPSGRFAASMAPDLNTNTLILFGGNNESALNDTWEWNGTNWIQLLNGSVGSPPIRKSASLAFDSSSGQLILFGGNNNVQFFNDTWNWNGTSWTQLSPVTSPAARTSAAMAYDPTIGGLILFGGFSSSAIFNDTWLWEGTDWVELTPEVSPTDRYASSLAFDSTSQQLVLFGGFLNTGFATNQTWLWLPLPTVTSIFPTFGPTSGGTTVIINGTGFTSVLAVNFGGNPATSFTVNSPTQITAVSPEGSAGVVNIIVTTAIGTSLPSTADQFTYVTVPGVPTVTAVVPNFGPTTGGTEVIISGTNFINVTAVKFGVNAAASFVVNSPTQIIAISPAGSAGVVDVTVTTPLGVSALSAADYFTYFSPPIALIFPPTHLKGFQKANRFATQTDYVNILTWKPPLQGSPPVAYRIYYDSQLKKLVAVVSSHEHLKFKDHNRKKGKSYTYFIVSIDQFGNVSAPATVTVRGRDVSYEGDF
jgi:hypothetical protein